MDEKIKNNFTRKIATFLIVASFFIVLPLPARASGITETSVFNLTNSQRAGQGVSSLSWNYKLASAARAKAQDMLDKDYFSHNSPDGRTPWSFITSAGYNYIYAGENLAMNFTSAEDMMAAWMASGGHRANILSGNFKELGVGVATGEYQGYTTIMVVQMFGSQATAVYENKQSSSGTAKNSVPKVASEVVIDPLTIATPSSNLIKKRIEDFKKASNLIIKLVKTGT